MTTPSLQFIQSKIGNFKPTVGLVLGSGLGFFAERLEKPINVAYKDIPEFPASTVEGHQGQFVFGYLGSLPIVCMQGRVHHYEGYDIKTVVLPIEIMIDLGIKHLMVTNAAGGIAGHFDPGTLMIIEDHINLSGRHPLIGKNTHRGPRFPDMSECYDKKYRQLIEEVAKENSIPVQKGIYLFTTGPSYETPAEIRAFRTLGADAVGMSTVPEVIIAKHAGISVSGISCITNKAAGLSNAPLSHAEVTETANRVQGQFATLLDKVLRKF